MTFTPNRMRSSSSENPPSVINSHHWYSVLFGSSSSANHLANYYHETIANSHADCRRALSKSGVLLDSNKRITFFQDKQGLYKLCYSSTGLSSDAELAPWDTFYSLVVGHLVLYGQNNASPGAIVNTIESLLDNSFFTDAGVDYSPDAQIRFFTPRSKTIIQFRIAALNVVGWGITALLDGSTFQYSVDCASGTWQDMVLTGGSGNGKVSGVSVSEMTTFYVQTPISAECYRFVPGIGNKLAISEIEFSTGMIYITREP